MAVVTRELAVVTRELAVVTRELAVVTREMAETLTVCGFSSFVDAGCFCSCAPYGWWWWALTGYSVARESTSTVYSNNDID
jgi:hypothetical protein